jgi:hypothetical protein
MIVSDRWLQGGADNMARGGEGLTVRMTKERCRACGGRIQEIRDRYGEVKCTRCCGCGKPAVGRKR